jgi:hypothetical protein
VVRAAACFTYALGIIEECGGRLVACHDDDGNTDWPSYVYVLTRD